MSLNAAAWALGTFGLYAMFGLLLVFALFGGRWGGSR
jgi:hypothetical protein